ncbi:probable phospholipid-transporting ATPase IF isoform X1 [Limulus polyphemus]|uniref:Phospholipid-transporting ATPase n=2 Tax=Limulus polyphemus TaxID=6850 RepID=A0ABM1SP73_LIMPO|nr:probable phospholipid-transporting ATPase IF isoform X1 [Limulus polyphemus]XP_022245430.1 probable phospholipid-transporting ATPase IF isoform X1 [Limulus polyphemus]XP_022245431.1 probable phospholipid-transporting ATPase IF isoform X1 [Limulus polyphemus]
MECLIFKRIHKIVRRASSRKSHEESRTVYVGHRHPPGKEDELEGKFPDNTVVSSKYTLWNFIPKNLFEQFRRIANFYFLCIAVIQLSINSPVSPLTSLAPLIFVVTVTAIKQGYEDWLRHRADRLVNQTLVRVIRGRKIDRIKSQDIRVGDIVMVKSNEEFPCDLVMLSSSNKEGHCHITTANLDGETNLKVHECLPETQTYQTTECLNTLIAFIECQNPTPNLYKFIGKMTLYRNASENTVCSLGPVNLLLKGARLKNTDFIFGCAVYTGFETKLSLNLRLTSNKFSTVERSMNKFLLFFLVLLVTEVSIATGLRYFYIRDPVLGVSWYLQSNLNTSAREVFTDFLAFLVLFNYIIPISLYVTIEMVKFFGVMFLTWDGELYDENSNECAKCNSSDLNEELGQVQYLFTDKTGTLTENDMVFRHSSIDGVKYTEHGGMLCKVAESFRSAPEPVFHYSGPVEDFLLVLAVCNTVQVYVKNLSNGFTIEISNNCEETNPEYHASSPDEKAFVEACYRFGVILHGFVEDNCVVTFQKKRRKLKRLHVLEFDSNRKCMSVIVKTEDGRIFLFCKGAESALLSKCISGPVDVTLQHINDYAMEGLRTMVIAQRELSEEEFHIFDKKIRKARTEMTDRENKVSKVINEIERNLTLLGATGVEDKLQEGVCETLAALRAAGIKVWVLTGDKGETAVNISYSSGHFQRGMVLMKLLHQESSSQCQREIINIKNIIEREPMSSYALVVDGHSLAFALHHHRDIFYEICRQCTAVLCCRMSPIQKAEIVKFIKLEPEAPITAAIGDGANDVSMIQEAHVGLGIMGKEGRQAVRCSDFAFARFRFLQRILLVHGHYYYIRVSTLVQYFFYKNIAFITPQVYYAFFNAFSAQTLYHSIYLMFFNIFFTSLPIIIYGLSEQHISQKTLLENPHLYSNIRRNSRMSRLQFAKWFVQGVWHSLVFYFGTYFFWKENTALFSDGQTLGLWSFGTAMFHTLVITINFKLCLHTRYWTGLFIFSVFITIIGFIGFSFLYCAFLWPFQDNNLYWVYINILSSPSVWILSIVLIIAALIPDALVLFCEERFSDVKRMCSSLCSVHLMCLWNRSSDNNFSNNSQLNIVGGSMTTIDQTSL